jgi:hypothetical protein
VAPGHYVSQKSDRLVLDVEIGRPYLMRVNTGSIYFVTSFVAGATLYAGLAEWQTQAT